MKKTLIGMLVLLLSVSCSKLKDLSDTGNTTKEMSNKLDTTNSTTAELQSTTEELLDRTGDLNHTTGEMNETTARLQALTGDLGGITANMYVQLRLKEAEETRDRRTKNLLEATSFHQKVTEAAAYFKAFEYQYWTDDAAAGDTEHVRDEKMMVAVQEYFRFMTEIITRVEADGGDIFDISKTMKDKTAMSLNALSVALHQIDDYQKVLIDEHGIKKVHMLNMIKDTLVKLNDLENGIITLADLKDHEKEILENVELARAILKIRFNTFGVMALSNVSDIADKNDLQKLTMILGGWDSKFHKLNIALQNKVLRYLREANITKQFLNGIGVESKHVINDNLKKLFGAMRTKESLNCAEVEEACNPEREAQKTEFKQLIEEYLK